MKRPTPLRTPPEPLAVVPEARRPPVNDSLVLGTAAACMRARAEAVLIWAQGDEADRYGTRDGARPDNPDKHVAEFRREMATLAVHGPRSIRGAEAVLNVVLDVLVQRAIDPDTVLADGPVVDLVRNVRDAIAYVDPDLAIGAGGQTGAST